MIPQNCIILLKIFSLVLFIQACTPPVVVKFTPLDEIDYSPRMQPANFYNESVADLLNGDYQLIGYIDFKQNIRKCYKDYQCEQVKSIIPTNKALTSEAAARGGDLISLLDENINLEQVSKNYCLKYITYSYIIDGKTYYGSRCMGYEHVDGFLEVKQRRALIWRFEPNKATAESNHAAIKKSMDILASVYDAPSAKSLEKSYAFAERKIKIVPYQLMGRANIVKVEKFNKGLLETGNHKLTDYVESLNQFISSPQAHAWRDQNGRNLLMTALLAKKHKEALMLVNSGLYSGFDNQGYNTLQYAIQLGNLELVKAMVAQEGKSILNKNYNLALPLLAVHNQDLRVLDWLLEQGLSRTETGLINITLFMYAAYRGQLAAVRLLHEKYQVDLNFSGANGATVLMIAAEAGKIQIVKYLLSKQIDINARDSLGYNAAHFAAMNGYLEVLQQLHADKANLNTINQHGYTPLHLAISRKHWHCVRFLLGQLQELETDKIKLKDIASELIRDDRITLLNKILSRYAGSISDNDLYDMLFLSALFDKSGFIRYLHDRKLNLNKENESQMTPLMIAASHGSLNAVLTLLKLNADPKKVSKDGLTALMYATLNGHLEVVRMMRNKGINN